jgi:hypothetical protein
MPQLDARRPWSHAGAALEQEAPRGAISPATPRRRSAACGAHRGWPKKSHCPGVIQTLPGDPLPLLASVRCANCCKASMTMQGRGKLAASFAA